MATNMERAINIRIIYKCLMILVAIVKHSGFPTIYLTFLPNGLNTLRTRSSPIIRFPQDG